MKEYLVILRNGKKVTLQAKTMYIGNIVVSFHGEDDLIACFPLDEISVAILNEKLVGIEKRDSNPVDAKVY